MTHQKQFVISTDVLSAAVDIVNKEQILNSIRNKLGKIEREPVIMSTTPNIIHAAVLIPFTYWNNELVILFTKRTNSVNSHQKQISFPGGVIEKEDKNPLAACLRETAEEIGVPPKYIEIFCELEARNTSTGFYIHPFVGFIHSLDEIFINKAEVERIIYIPLRWLRDSKNSYTEIFKGPDNRAHSVVAYKKYDGDKVWGITASLLKRLIEKIKNSEA